MDKVHNPDHGEVTIESEGGDANEEDKSKNNEGEAKKSGAQKLPQTTIRRIDRRKDICSGKADSVCKSIITKYNENNKRRYEEIKSLKELSIKNLVYMKKDESTSKLAKIFTPESEEKSVTFSYVVFMITENDNIYCLTYGDAYHLVQDLGDKKFVRDVSKYAVDKKIRMLGRRNLKGIDYAVTRFYRNPTIPTRLQIHGGVVTTIQGRVSGEILEKTDALELDTQVGVRVELSRSGVRFMKDLEMGQICDVINELDDEKVGKEGDGCDIMDYIIEVEEEGLNETLEENMFDMILKYIEKDENDMHVDGTDEMEAANDVYEARGDPPPFDFMYKDFENHMKGENFKIHLLPSEEDIKSYEVLESFADAVNALRDYLNNALLKKLMLTFTVEKDGMQHKCRFVDLLRGKVEHKGTEYTIDAGKWQYDDTVVGEKGTLDNILADHLLEDMKRPENGQFEVYFEKRKFNPLTDCSFRIKRSKSEKGQKFVLRSYSEALRELKRYLRKHLEVSFTANKKLCKDLMLNFFHGEMVFDDEKKKDGSRIYHKVDGKWYKYDQQFNNCLHDSFTSLLRQKFKDDGNSIHLPEVWAPGWKESKYNQRYCEDKYDGKYFVGDTIKPYYVELFDVMKVLDDKIYLYHIKKDFGVITRDACSQIRNSASAINESRHGGGQENYLEKYYKLVTEFDGNVNDFRLKEKKRLEKIGRETFLEWFQTKRIVFVYAFAYRVKDDEKGSKKNDLSSADTGQRENALTRAKIDTTSDKQTASGSKPAQKSADKKRRTEKHLKTFLKNGKLAGFSKSTIAKRELYSTNLYLEELGFEFAICQIARYESNEERRSQIARYESNEERRSQIARYESNEERRSKLSMMQAVHDNYYLMRSTRWVLMITITLCVVSWLIVHCSVGKAIANYVNFI